MDVGFLGAHARVPLREINEDVGVGGDVMLSTELNFEGCRGAYDLALRAEDILGHPALLSLNPQTF